MRKHVARLLVAAAALAALIAFVVPGGAPAATTGACTLAGTASVTPGLKTANQAITYTFTGKFSNCKGTGKVTSGTVSASGKGTGSCSGNTTTGTASVRWNTGQTSALSFSTKGTGALVNVTGKFVLNGGSRIIASGIQPKDVLYNIIGSGPQVAFTGGGGGSGCCKSSADGTLIALHRNIALSPGLVNGELIGGQNISIVSGSSVKCPPSPCVP